MVNPGGLDGFNARDDDAARAGLAGVCASPGWVEGMLSVRPYASPGEAAAVSTALVATLPEAEIDAALDGHPRIGERSGEASSAAEQAAVLASGEDFLERLRAANRRYEETFGHVYLVAAAGRPPEELYDLLIARLGNSPGRERAVVRRELAAINAGRLAALLGEPAARAAGPAPGPRVPAPDSVEVSTHVLDTTTGRPAVGMAVELRGPDGPAGAGVTDADGRIHPLAVVPPGRYTALFATGEYFPDGLYPEVAITLDLTPGSVHLPLLLSPFAYSTYRGS